MALPELLVSRDEAGQKIGDCIEQLKKELARIPEATDATFEDVVQEVAVQRRYAIELLGAIFAETQPAAKFEKATARTVYYTDRTLDQRRRELTEVLRNGIQYLRELTAQLEFAKPDTSSRETLPLAAILLFTLLLVGFAGLLVWQQDRIGKLSGFAAFGFVAIIALVSAILLFGLFRTVARVSGRVFGVPVVLAGPAALFVIVLAAGLGLRQTEAVDHAPAADPIRDEVPTGTAADDPAQTMWTERFGFPAVTFKGRFWVFGGHKGSNDPASYFNDVWSSRDMEQWNLVTRDAFWEPRVGHTVTVLDDQMVLLGGAQIAQGVGYRAYNDVAASVDGREWRRLTSKAPWSARWDHAAVAHKGYVWLLGGCSMQDGSDPNVPLHEGASESINGQQHWLGGHNDVWRSRDGVQWEHVGKAPWSPRWDHAALAFNDGIWVLGGYDGERFLADVWYSRDGTTWRIVTDEASWAARAGHTVTAVGNRLWLVGGYHRDWGARTVVNDAPWSSLDGKTWEQEGSFGELGVWDHAALPAKNQLYLLGGWPPATTPVRKLPVVSKGDAVAPADGERARKAHVAGHEAFQAAIKIQKKAESDRKMREALAHFRTAESLNPHHATYAVSVGACLNRLGRHEEALPPLERAIALRNDIAWFHNEHCVALRTLKRFAAAEKSCREAIRLDPRNATFQEQLAATLTARTQSAPNG